MNPIEVAADRAPGAETLLGPRVAAVCDSFSVGGVRVRLSGECAADIALFPPVDLFRSENLEFDIAVEVEWVSIIPSSMKRQMFDAGSTWRLFESEAGYQFDFHSETLGPQPYRRLLIDRKFTSAKLDLSEDCFSRLPAIPEPLGYPLDELLIMHRLTQERAIELHGTGIVRASGVANLFIGHSGAGKSTTTRLWTSREEVEVLSDDRIIVRLDDGRHGLAGPTGMRMYGTPWHGEAMFASPNSAPLTRIFILEHGYGNVITRLSRSQAVGELFARAFVPFHRHEYVEAGLSFLEELAGAVPCYLYSFEPNECAVEKIQNFND
jgi:hypothetical protein